MSLVHLLTQGKPHFSLFTLQNNIWMLDSRLIEHVCLLYLSQVGDYKYSKVSRSFDVHCDNTHGGVQETAPPDSFHSFIQNSIDIHCTLPHTYNSYTTN